MICIGVRIRKSSNLKAGCNNECTNMTPRANNELFGKCDESNESYVEVQESSSTKAVVFHNIDTNN